MLREVANWRDTVAAQLDRATFRVMGNEVLFELARTTPRSVSELAAIKGMPKGMLDRAGSDIVAADATPMAPSLVATDLIFDVIILAFLKIYDWLL